MKNEDFIKIALNSKFYQNKFHGLNLNDWSSIVFQLLLRMNLGNVMLMI